MIRRMFRNLRSLTVWERMSDIIDFAKDHEAIVTIHAGRKTNGVDDRITNSLDHNQAVKEEFAFHHVGLLFTGVVLFCCLLIYKKVTK